MPKHDPLRQQQKQKAQEARDQRMGEYVDRTLLRQWDGFAWTVAPSQHRKEGV
jgi:hypothetical protein